MSEPDSIGPHLRPDNLDHLRKHAKRLLRDARNGNHVALARFANVLGTADPGSLSLSQSQLVVARETGFTTWRALRDEVAWRHEVRSKHRLDSASPGPIGETAMKTESLQLAAIDQIGLTCTDLDEAEQFYCGILGLRLSGQVEGVMKFFACDSLNVVLFRSETVSPNSILYFRVPPESGLIEQKVGLLKSKGVHVETEAHVIARNWNGCDIWTAFFRDPFGNLLALKSDVPVR